MQKKLFFRLNCGCFPCFRHDDDAIVVADNCCQCNYAALRRMIDIGEVEVVYATFHVDVGETPFFVALDYTRQKVRPNHRIKFNFFFFFFHWISWAQAWRTTENLLLYSSSGRYQYSWNLEHERRRYRSQCRSRSFATHPAQGRLARTQGYGTSCWIYSEKDFRWRNYCDSTCKGKIYHRLSLGISIFLNPIH